MAGLIAIVVLAYILDGYLSPGDNRAWVEWFHSQPGQWRFMMAAALLAVAALDDLGDKIKAAGRRLKR